MRTLEELADFYRNSGASIVAARFNDMLDSVLADAGVTSVSELTDEQVAECVELMIDFFGFAEGEQDG